jgi:hypothetical protein
MVSTHDILERRESATLSLVIRLRLTIRLPFLMQILLELLHRQAGADSSHIANLQSTAIEAWAVCVIALADNLSTTYDDAAMAEVERRFVGLLQAQGKI